MFKKKPLLVVFEGIEGSGKSYHSKKLYKKVIKLNLPAVFTREPGGSANTEQIRKILLTGEKNKFNNITDTLLYLASRSEHVQKVFKPAFLKKKIIICDRFVDSTIAYQVHGYGVNKKMVDLIHKEILGNIKADLTFLLKLNVYDALKRLNKRKSLNRYDKLSIKFYQMVQRKFLNLAKKNKKKYIVIDTSKNIKSTEKKIYDNFIKILKK